MRKHVLIALCLCIALSGLAFGFASMLGGHSQPSTTSHSPHSLREKAKLNGTHTVTVSPDKLRMYNNAQALTHDSAVVITGVVNSETAQMSPAEDFIFTDYQVSVRDVLKGSLQPGDTITVRTPGGRVQFDGGTAAEVKMPDFWKNPEVGGTYVFFLKKKDESHLGLVGGPQGLFDISSGTGVEPQVRDQDLLMHTYRGKEIASFVQEIRQAAGQK